MNLFSCHLCCPWVREIAVTLTPIWASKDGGITLKISLPRFTSTKLIVNRGSHREIVEGDKQWSECSCLIPCHIPMHFHEILMIPQFPESKGSKSIVLSERDSTSELWMFSNSQQYSEGEYLHVGNKGASLKILHSPTIINRTKSISSQLCNNLVNSAIENSCSP